ncbi:hypothetical protein ACHAW6_011818 [Cyclotella cf. meneghiniana]
MVCSQDVSQAFTSFYKTKSLLNQSPIRSNPSEGARTMAADDNHDDAISPKNSSSCPVMIRRDASSTSSTGNQTGGFWSRFFPRSESSSNTERESTSQCPVKGIKSIPASIEEAANHSQIPAPGQRIPLSTQRVISSIPRGDVAESLAAETTTPPAHQPPDSSLWMYPSEQQFYNAMLRKGYRPPIESIPSVLRIHNAVNERSWLQVCKWEKELHGNEDPKLVKFVGRPKDISPKAWFNSRILMTQEPFDRHDWYVETKSGEPRRYVIDFYEGKEKTGDVANLAGKEKGSGKLAPVMRPPSMYIDVRPALDNPSAALDRMTMFVRDALPGIASLYDSCKAQTSSSNEASGDVGIDSSDHTERQ